ncbi:tetratricopeptide repeat protein [Psychroflexus tropicus]|uniref:tetratricopeptide repeat protein n=1 Tax=Psychroflexus tropicus TaxID=197345 RepID=UPI00037AF806|nr:tetratricopeptide repeat protein [Psychroflexus tropicus]
MFLISSRRLRFNLVLFSFLCLSFSLSIGQNPELADNYFDQGEYEKAESLFAKLHQKSPAQQSWLLKYVETLQALGKTKKAETVLKEYLTKIGKYPNIQIELGYLYQKNKDTVLAQQYYQKAIAQVESRPSFSYTVGSTFQKYGLLDLAIQTYETAQQIQPKSNNTIQLARIYGEQSRYEKMFENYIELIAENPNYFQILNRNFTQYITKDSESKPNRALRKVLLKRNQQNPELVFNQMLSWLFVQQEDYAKAFAQERAVFQRSELKSLSRIINLASISKANNDLESAEQMLEFAIQNSTSERTLISATRELLLIDRLQAQPEEYDIIENEYSAFLSKLGNGRDTFSIQKDRVEFTAYQLGNFKKALALIEDMNFQNLYQQQLAELKLLEADLYLHQSQFNQALLLYTQVEKIIPNSDLAREAKFKVAKTSYFTGDFDWALTQLKVLKTSASQLMANDAMELSLLIKDNSQVDSTRTDLKLVAKADLLQFQNQPEAALDILNKVVANYKSSSIVDEALLRIAKIHLEKQNYNKALSNLQRIVDEFGDKILADNANFLLGQLYMDELDAPEQARPYFETIIFNHPDSIYVVEARKRFRQLRGDQIQ